MLGCQLDEKTATAVFHPALLQADVGEEATRRKLEGFSNRWGFVEQAWRLNSDVKH